MLTAEYVIATETICVSPPIFEGNFESADAPNAHTDINLEGFLLPVSNESHFHPLSPTF